MSKLDGEMSTITMGQSIFNAYRNAMLDSRNVFCTQWDDLDEQQQFAWVSAAETALDFLEDAENLPWVTLASHMFSMFVRRADYMTRDFDELDQFTKAAWVVAARHAANLCALEGGDLTEHEERWIGAAKGLEQVLVSNE